MHSTYLCLEFPFALRAALGEDFHGCFHPIRKNGFVHRTKGPLAHLGGEATRRLMEFPEMYKERKKSECMSNVAVVEWAMVHCVGGSRQAFEGVL